MTIPKRLQWPGHRTLKTAIAVVTCIFFYQTFGRVGMNMAITAAIICMQESVEKSVSSGRSRIISTLFGGILGIAFVLTGLTDMGEVAFLACAFLGIIILIHASVILDMPGNAVMACLVFMTIIISAVSATQGTEISPVAYSIDRIIDTIIGIVISLFINVFFFRPKEGSEGEQIEIAPLDFHIVNSKNLRVSKWSGGSTTELFIFPEESFYDKRDFDFRISTATVETESSNFTRLPGFKRYIMPIEGSMHLNHEGRHEIKLDPFHKDFFMGEWNTLCEGKCVDFNLMIKEGYTGGITDVKSGFCQSFSTKEHVSFFILEDNVEAFVHAGGIAHNLKLCKGDFLFFKHFPAKGELLYEIKLESKIGFDGVLAVNAECSNINE